MKFQLKQLIVIAGILSATAASAADFGVDAAHSHVGFKVRHLVTKVQGEFKDFDGSFSFDEKNLDASKASFTIKSTSISTNNEKRDGHLRTKDFFDVKKYPTITFVGKKLEADGDKRYKLTGDFTMHGVTKPVTFEVEYGGATADPFDKSGKAQRAGFTATTSVNRKDFGIVWNKTLDAGGLMLGEDVAIELNVEGVSK